MGCDLCGDFGRLKVKRMAYNEEMDGTKKSRLTEGHLVTILREADKM